jgi:hypothetical protein
MSICPTSHYMLLTIYWLIMSPLGIKRLVAVLLVLSPWIFIPGLFKDAIFIILGILLFISTLDLRRKVSREVTHQETESMPVRETQTIA